MTRRIITSLIATILCFTLVYGVALYFDQSNPARTFVICLAGYLVGDLVLCKLAYGINVPRYLFSQLKHKLHSALTITPSSTCDQECIDSFKGFYDDDDDYVDDLDFYDEDEDADEDGYYMDEEDYYAHYCDKDYYDVL